MASPAKFKTMNILSYSFCASAFSRCSISSRPLYRPEAFLFCSRYFKRIRGIISGTRKTNLPPILLPDGYLPFLKDRKSGVCYTDDSVMEIISFAVEAAVVHDPMPSFQGFSNFQSILEEAFIHILQGRLGIFVKLLEKGLFDG